MPPIILRKSVLEQKIAEAGGPVPATVLVVCGDMIRRSSQRESARTEETERALAALSPASVVEALAAIDLSQVRQETQRAIDESFEAAFADSPEERALFATSAMSALAARDRLESLLVAARERARLLGENGEGAAELGVAVDAREEAASALDRELERRVRSLTAVNAERRAELAKLDEPRRARAWWYAARSEAGDDELLIALGDLPGGDATVTHLGAAAQADVGSSGLPDLDRAAVAAGLRRAALDQSTPAERGWLAGRASADPELARDLALADDRSLDAGE